MTIDIIEQDVFTALVSLLTSFLPAGTEVVYGQDNRVPMPLGGFVTMTSAGMDRLSINVDTYNYANQTKSILTPTNYKIQLDFYGANSQAWAMQAQALFRDAYATDTMPANIQPLYADNPIQLPLIDGEAQYEQRWKLTANIQYNPLITTSQQSMTAINVTLAPIDQTFKP